VLESVADSVLIHPNVLNAGGLYGGAHSWYVDGLTLDRLFAGVLRLAPPSCAAIGLIIDKTQPGDQIRILNAANSLRAVSGIPLLGYVVTREKVAASVTRSPYGHFLGKVENPEVLFEAAEMLVAQGANMLAVVTAIEGVSAEDLRSHYFQSGPNPVGSVEALISRAITTRTGVPCAHAPMYVSGLGNAMEIVDPRAAAEVASGSGLPCLLYGLPHSPRAVQESGIGIADLSAIIVPFDCAGGMPALAARRFDIPLIAVKANHCAVGVQADLLNVPSTIVVDSYAEAIAFVACQKAGVSWESIRRPIDILREFKLGVSE